MSSDSDATTSGDDAATEPAQERDEAREAQLATMKAELGSAILDSHIRPGDDLWIRVERDAWVDAARAARSKLKCDFFDFLSAIDWMPSPFGRSLDSQEDIIVQSIEPKELPEMAQGYAGGETRFQMLARVYSTTAHMGINLKADLPDDDLRVDTWAGVYAGSDWHERETAEMFGIDFTGHPNLIHMYLPSQFEGYPLRKDFPLLARRVKPWPGIVDIEPMPDAGSDGEGGDD